MTTISRAAPALSPTPQPQGFKPKGTSTTARVAMATAGAAITVATVGLANHVLTDFWAGASTGSGADIFALPIVMAATVAVAFGTMIGQAAGGSMIAAAAWPDKPGAPLDSE